MKIDQADGPMKVFGLWYGQGKMLKTSLALLMPPMFRPIQYFDCDMGAKLRLRLLAMTVAEREALGVPPSTIYDHAGPWIKEGVTLYQPEESTYYKDALDFAQVHAPKVTGGSIVVDTLSRLADGIFEEIKSTPIVKSGGKESDARARLTTGGDAVSYISTQQDYGLAQDRVMEFIKTLVDRNRDKHIWLISHEKTGEVKDSSGAGRVLAGPRTVGNALIEVLPSMVDIALRFEPRMVNQVVGGKMQQVQTVAVRTRNHNIYLAGDRSGLFQDGAVMNPEEVWAKFAQVVTLGAAVPPVEQVPARAKEAS